MLSASYNSLKRATPSDNCDRKDIPPIYHQYDRLGIRSSSLGGARRSPSSVVVPDSTSSVTAARRVSKKYRSTREYLRLKAILPSVSNKRTVSKLTVIEEAIRYIDHLHATLASRMTTDGQQPVSDDSPQSSSLAPEEFVRRLCFGSFLNDLQPAESASDMRRRAMHLDRRPLSERTPLNQCRSRNTPSSGLNGGLIGSATNR